MPTITLSTGTPLLTSAGAAGLTNAPPPNSLNITPRLVVLDSIMTEGGVLVFNVCRRHPYGFCTVDYAITDGTAVVNTDYDNTADALTGTLTFGFAGVFSKQN